MSEYCGYVCEVRELRKHPNADRLQIATFFGNDTCVGLNVVQGEIGIYFPSDLQLSVEFCDENHMCRKRADGTDDTGYLDRDKRNIRPIKLRGEKSDGIFVPLSAVAYTGINLDELNIGDKIEMLNGHEICCKYIPRGRAVSTNRIGNKAQKKKKKKPIAPLFTEHCDTEQLSYNLNVFRPGDQIEITLKMHGTSMRTGYLPVLKGYKRTFLDKIFHREGKPIYKYDYISGTRRTVLEDFEGGFYGSNAFRKQHHDKFIGKLHKGEEIYYEVVGFTHTGAPIMAEGNNEKLGKDFVKQYGKTTTFSYGCDCAEQAWKENRGQDVDKPKSDVYVYRMTMTNEDGDVVEYSPDFMRYRCEQMGIKTVPLLDKFTVPGGDRRFATAGDWVKNKAEKFYDGPDPIGKTHIREGVVVRIVNRPKFTAFKHKNFDFKVLSNIAIEQAIETGAIEKMSDDEVSEL